MGRAIRAGRDCQPLLAALVAAVFLAAPVQAAEAPLWEFGLGIGVLGYADYRGADSSHVFPVPVPYFTYNGPFLKADRDGVHTPLFNEEWVELKLSGNATTPVSNNRERSGMPELRPTVELGASLDFHLWRSEDARIKWDLRMPLRSAFAVESPPQAIGWTFTPAFALDFVDPAGYVGWKAGLLVGPLFANRRFDEYFYSVAQQYATTSRPAFQADAGYAGTQFVAAVSKRFPRFWVGAFMRYDTLAGAVFAASPLVQRDSYWTAGFGIAWMIGRSARTVEVTN